ncbi:MAG: hypothetical protein KatS3mg113_0941 [Planctomycetaceae bacterium]|nr:MAG: hypothetical protein KatS3mg113_0941 [Planctomycetaceae bacterium]
MSLVTLKLEKQPDIDEVVAHDRQQAIFVIQSWGQLSVALVMLATLLYLLPLFLRMPVTNDAEMYDLQTWLWLRGGILYRDVLEPNLPGVIWLQSLVRLTFGWSSEALRGFDAVLSLVWASLAAWLVWIIRGSQSRALLTMGLMLLCYWSLSEWNHCQRDIWLLVPALTACMWRLYTTGRKDVSHVWQVGAALVEGMIWGCGVWLKPHILVPACVVWGVSQLHRRDFKRTVSDGTGMLLGGMIAGAVGSILLIRDGSWIYLWETLRDWNPDYVLAGRNHWTLPRFLAMVLRFLPWFTLHVAVLVGVGRWFCNSLHAPTPHAEFATSASTSAGQASQRHLAIKVIIGLYCAWSFQAYALQHLFDYVHAPLLMLAILTWMALGADLRSRLSRVVFGTWLLWALAWSPHFRWSVAEQWLACWQPTMSPTLRDRLSHFENPHLADLERILSYLREQRVHHRDVCFYNSDFVQAYRRLEIEPPTRFVYLYETIRFLPRHRDEILKALQQQPHRFVVTDVLSAGIPAERVPRLGPAGVLPGVSAQPKHWSKGYPWSYPVVYRAGTYLVHRVPDKIDALSLPLSELRTTAPHH